MLSGIHDATGELLRPTISSLELDFLGGGPLHGIGMQFDAGFGLVAGLASLTVSDGTQVASQGGSLGSSSSFFLGILSTEPLDLLAGGLAALAAARRRV